MATAKKKQNTTKTYQNIKHDTQTQEEATPQEKNQMYAPRPVRKKEKPRALPRSQKK